MSNLSQLWQWLNDHSSVLNLAINLAMLVVWAAYLHVFVREYRQSRRCRILINFAGGLGLAGRCLVSNMSSEPIYVMAVVAVLDNGRERVDRSLTSFPDQQEADQTSPLEQRTRQGPLMKGQWRDLGSFADLLRQTGQLPGDRDLMDSLTNGGRPLALELTVVAIYDSDPLPVAARRRFSIQRRGDAWRLRPTMPDTEQIRRRRDRRRLSWMD